MPVYGAGAGGGSAATVADMIDRVYRDYLYQGDDQPVVVTSATDYSDIATTIVYDGSTLAPDEVDLIGVGCLVEVGLEQMRVTDVDEEAASMTVTRAVNGTTATAISSGDEITLVPVYSRLSVFDAVCDAVYGLFPDLWQYKSTTVTTNLAPVDFPADTVVLGAVQYLTGNRVRPISAELIESWPPSATGKAIQFNHAPSGKTAYVDYEARFSRPTALDDVLDDYGILSSWERIIAVGAAAQVTAGRESDQATSEYITEQLEREGRPVGSDTRIRNGYLQLYSAWIDQANRDLRRTRPRRVEMSV